MLKGIKDLRKVIKAAEEAANDIIKQSLKRQAAQQLQFLRDNRMISKSNTRMYALRIGRIS